MHTKLHYSKEVLQSVASVALVLMSDPWSGFVCSYEVNPVISCTTTAAPRSEAVWSSMVDHKTDREETKPKNTSKELLGFPKGPGKHANCFDVVAR